MGESPDTSPQKLTRFRSTYDWCDYGDPESSLEVAPYKFMRTVYVLIILGLVLFMSEEFKFFTRHYTWLENQLDYTISNCKN